MRMQLNLVAGMAAAALALTACGVTAGASGGTPAAHAAPVSARHAQTDNRVTELKDLGQVKRETSWKAADPVRARQPQSDTSRLAELRDLAGVKRETSWKAAELAWAR
jgi:hypothetical protein